MRAVSRQHALAAVALLAASVVAVTPLASRTVELPAVSMETRLVDESIFNIPFNLFQDIVNIPYNQVQAIDFAAQSLLNSGPWFVVSPTNLWGVDPGDPSHFMAVTNLLVPFPELSGMNSAQGDFSAGLGQQIWGMVAAELPTSSGCDAMDCLPVSPTSPITGISGVDWSLWLSQIASGQQQFPLFENWFKVPFDELVTGYTFSPTADGSIGPSGPTYTIFPEIPGTGAGDAMPWSGETYTLQPWAPFENFLNSLEATPDYSAFNFPSFEETGRAFQSLLAASVMAFNPYTPGSPFCPGECTLVTDANLDYPHLIQAIEDAWPGNADIQTWLAAFASGQANVPTDEQIQNSIQILQQPFWDFDNPSPPAGTGPDFSQLTAQFYQFWTDLGLNPSDNPPPYEVLTALNAFDSAQPAADWATPANAFDPTQLAADWAALMNAFDPTQLAADWATLVNALDPATLSADLTAMMTPFADTLGPELATALLGSL
jgi:hypothetical protein